MQTKRVSLINEDLSVIGFGCWATGGSDVWNNVEDAASVAAIRRAVDLGVNFFDVAPVYGLGHAEEVLGRALQGRRENVFIATKCGLVWDERKRIRRDLRAASIKTEIDASLQRLQTDVIDLYQVHWPDPNTPIEETMSALAEIRESGKIRYIGVSNFSLDLLKQARAITQVVSHQGLYNLLERNADSYYNTPLDYRTEREILPYCEHNGLAFFPYSPLFQGLLSGSFKPRGHFNKKDVRRMNPKLGGELFLKYYGIVERLQEFATEIGHPLNQIAINWLVRQKAVTSVIAGARTVRHIEGNVASTTWTLTDDMATELENILGPYKQQGLI